MNPQVDEYFRKAKTWREELAALRTILIECPLTEDWKWRAPCYTSQNKNIAILAALKDCCTLSFFKGALLADPHGLLSKPGVNTQASRVIHFTDRREIVEHEAVLKSYIQEAIEVEKAGLKVELDENRELETPIELQEKFDENPALKTAFNALTPGRQRAYHLYFSGAKQSRTRTSRIERYTQQILDGKGFNDCTCGLSQKMPACDGSHKDIRSGN